MKRARKHGYDIRPTDHRTLSAKKARKLIQVNKRLFKRCAYRYIQEAVTASGNNDRVVVMPGLYRERKSRRQPTYRQVLREVHRPPPTAATPVRSRTTTRSTAPTTPTWWP